MNVTETTDSLESIVNRNSPPTRTGKSESHTLESLSKRVLAPVDACQQFIANGLLTPENSLTKNDSGVYVFSSDDLNDLRRAVLTELVGKVVENSDGNGDDIPIAANHAVRTHIETFQGKSKTTELSRRVSASGAFMFGRPTDEEQQGPGLVKTAATTAAIGGLGLYAAGTFAAHKTARSIAQKYGQAAADKFLANQGIGTRIRDGWSLTKGAVTGAARSGVTGVQSGALDALKKLRLRGTGTGA